MLSYTIISISRKIGHANLKKKQKKIKDNSSEKGTVGG